MSKTYCVLLLTSLASLRSGRQQRWSLTAGRRANIGRGVLVVVITHVVADKPLKQI